MNEIVLEVKNVTKTYKHVNAVDNATLSIERGKIYGFIGQNGAGKTTLIRILTGLIFPNSGSISIFSSSNKSDLELARKKIGVIVENPALYLNMSAYENLDIQRKLFGIKDKNIINSILNTVGLLDTKNKKVKNFSLGMKQRLSIGLALINDPEILILDEPINGLDPVGIAGVRELLKKINKEKNITIIISSHILSELYQLATNYIIINKGEIIQELTLDELDEKCMKHIFMQVDNVSQAVDIIENNLRTNHFQVLDNNIIKLYDYTDNMKHVAKVFLENNALITYFTLSSDSLESYYINLIGGGINA